MQRTKNAPTALLLLPLAVAIAALAIAGLIPLRTSEAQTTSVGAQTAPAALPPPPVNVSSSAADQFERNPILSLPEVFVHQNTPGSEVPPEAMISQPYIATVDRGTRLLSLKEAIYVAIRNNPALAATQLDPIAATESVNQANAAFDPDLTSQLDVTKQVTPVSSVFQVLHGDAYTQKFYDWNFGVNKVFATTNGTLSLNFDNDRALTNSAFSSVNPVLHSRVRPVTGAAAAAQLWLGLRAAQRSSGRIRATHGAMELWLSAERFRAADRGRLLGGGRRRRESAGRRIGLAVQQ